MRIVNSPVCRPMRCAVLPYVGAAHPTTRWVDTGSELPDRDNHVYVSEIAVCEMAGLFGMVTPAAHKALGRELEDAQARVAVLEEQLAEQERQLQAIDALESAGFRARRKPGRKSGVEIPAA